jgi:hypothetical protein
MKAPPLLLGGSWPVVAYFKHSMMVCYRLVNLALRNQQGNSYGFSRAVISNDESQRGVELNGFTAYVVEGANTIVKGSDLPTRLVWL